MIAGTVALKGPHGSRLKDRIRSSAAETRWHAPPELGRPRRKRIGGDQGICDAGDARDER
jgi:hypothetical protein